MGGKIEVCVELLCSPYHEGRHCSPVWVEAAEARRVTRDELKFMLFRLKEVRDLNPNPNPNSNPHPNPNPDPKP